MHPTVLVCSFFRGESILLRLSHTVAVVFLVLAGLCPAYAVLPAPAHEVAKKLPAKSPKKGSKKGVTKTPAPALVAKNYDSATSREIVRNAATLYDVLMGYLQLQRGATTQAYTHLLNAAQRNPDTKLFAQTTEVALHNRDYESALATLAKWKAAFPSDPTASTYHLHILVALGRIEQTGTPLQQAFDNTEAGKKQAFIHSVPALYELSKKPDVALAAASPMLHAALKKPETAFIAATALARMQIMARQYPQAQQSVQQAILADVPDEKLGVLPNRELPGLIAIDLMRLGRATASNVSSQAEALVRNMLQGGDNSSDFVMTYAKTLAEVRRYDEALPYLHTLLQKKPDYAAGWALQAGIQIETRQWDAAQHALQRYLDIRQTESSNAASYTELDTQVYLMLARVADEHNDLQAAAGWIRRIEPAQVRAHIQLQRIELLIQQQGKYELALQMLQSVPAHTPREKTAHALLTSLVYEKQERFDDSARVLSAALEHDSNNHELLYLRGFAYSQLGQHAKSEKDWRKVIRLQPQSANAYNALGYGLADRNERLPEAHALITKALSLNPHSSAIRDSMGWVEYRLGRLPQARLLLQQAFVAEPQAEIAAHYGEVLWKSGEREHARTVWQQGFRLDPKDKVLLETMHRLDPDFTPHD